MQLCLCGRTLWALGRLWDVSAGLWDVPHDDYHHYDDHFLLSAGDGSLLWQRGVWRRTGMSSSVRVRALSIGHGLYGDGSDLVRVPRRVDPVR